MVDSDLPDDYEHIAGDGGYAIEVVSDSDHQDALEWLVRGRGEAPTDYSCTAVLVPEPDNPFDPDAVSVSILGVEVGYLPPEAAATMAAAMEAWGFSGASCEAIIEGGWYRSAEDKGDFCVRLDANPDFAPATLADVDSPAPPPAFVATAPAAPKAAYDFRSMGLGAIATFAVFALIGFVWLLVQPPAEPETSLRSVVVSTTQAPEPTRRREARLASPGVTETAVIEARRIPQAAAATLAQPQPALRPSTARLSDQRSLVAAVETVRDVLVVPAPAPVNALPPIVSDDAVGAPAAGAGGGRLDAVSAAGPVGRPQLIAVLPPPVAREIGPVLDRRRSVAATATPVAAEVDAPAVDAFTLPVPAPVPRPASLESNPDTPPAQAAVQTDRPETKARSSAGRPRAKARSRAEARKARARWRKAPRRARRTQRAVQSQQNPGRARLKPESGASSGSMAARMIQGWTREWTTPLRVRPRPAQ